MRYCRPRFLQVVFAGLVALAAGAVTGCGSAGRSTPVVEQPAPTFVTAVQKLVGPGCAAYSKANAEGPGSVEELADKPVAEAIEDHPMLERFAAAISGRLNEKVNLTRELDGGEFTVFAPTDAAFRAKVPEDWARTLAQPSSAEALTDVLLRHLLVGQREPSELRGSLETRGGSRLSIEADGDRIRIDGQANVICGGLRTENATIYLIDSVLMPSAQRSERNSEVDDSASAKP